MAKYRDMLNRFESMKLNIYVENLFSPRLNEDEDTQLEMDLSLKTNLDPFVSYLLSKINFTIISSSQFDIQVKEKSLVSLKDKFMNILQAMEAEEVRTENIGLLLYIASRLYVAHDSKRTYLISVLKSALFSQTHTWDLYFIQRVNRGLSQTHKSSKTTFQKTLGILKSPFELMGITKNEEPSAEKDAMNRKEFHPAVLMEIAQHLVQLNVGPDDSTQTLIDIFRKYSIESLLMKGVFVVHQKAISSQFEGRIYQSLIQRSKYDQSHVSKLNFVLSMTAKFLNPQDILRLSEASKSVCNHLRTQAWLGYQKKINISLASRSILIAKSSFDHLEKCLEVTKLLPIDQCKLTAEQSRLIEFDTKRTTKNPIILEVEGSYLETKVGADQLCVNVFEFNRLPPRYELHGTLPLWSLLY